MGKPEVVSRNLTASFVQLRHDKKGVKRLSGSVRNPGDAERSLLKDDYMGQRQDVEMARVTLPPEWVDSAEDAREDIRSIKAKLVQLTKAQQKRLLDVFGNDDQPDKAVEQISADIGKLARHCEYCIVQVKTRGAARGVSDTDVAFRENVQKNLATELQKLSQQFRQAQKGFLESLRRRDNGVACDEPRSCLSQNDEDTGFTKDQLVELADMEVNAGQRSEEICQIATSISELHTIFKELAVLVIDQGSILDRIDYNIEQVVTRSKQASKELVKAEKAQKSNRATNCILALVLANAILILILIYKVRH